MEVWWFGGDPTDKSGDRFVCRDCLNIVTDPRELGIAKVGMDRFVANGMDGDCAAPFLRFRYRMMPLDQRLEWAPAQPANLALFDQNGSARPVS